MNNEVWYFGATDTPLLSNRKEGKGKGDNYKLEIQKKQRHRIWNQVPE